MTHEKVDWHEAFANSAFTHLEVWNVRDVLGPGKRLGTLWFWAWGFVAEVMALAPHPFSWGWGGISLAVWAIAIAGMRVLDSIGSDTIG